MKKATFFCTPLVFLFLICSQVGVAQVFTTQRYYIQEVRIDTNSNPVKMRVRGIMADSYIANINITSLNDAANTQVVRIKSGGCRYFFFISWRFDTLISLPTRRPFDLKLYLDWDNTIYPCSYTNMPNPTTDSLFIRYNQILDTDDPTQIAAQINIAPNPSNGTFALQHDADIQIQTATIYDLRGALIQRITDVGDKIEMPTVVRGVYFVRLQTNRGEVVKKVFLE